MHPYNPHHFQTRQPDLRKGKQPVSLHRHPQKSLYHSQVSHHKKPNRGSLGHLSHTSTLWLGRGWTKHGHQHRKQRGTSTSWRQITILPDKLETISGSISGFKLDLMLPPYQQYKPATCMEGTKMQAMSDEVDSLYRKGAIIPVPKTQEVW